MTAAVLIVGLSLTALAVGVTARIDDATEQRLLDGQTRQAAAVLAGAIAANEQPLASALTAIRQDPDPALFRSMLASAVGPDRTFATASLWERDGDRLIRRATVGSKPAFDTESPAFEHFMDRAFSADSFSATEVRMDSERRIAYAVADAASGHVVFAERAIPPSGRSRVDSNPAFHELDYANYFGPTQKQSALTTTNVDPDTLPFAGRRAVVRVPFGDTVLTMVTAPRGHLGASLSRWLPYILLGSGVFLTLLSLALGRTLVRRRLTAEENAAVAVGMSERLQRALLPLTTPEVPNLEVAVEYVAGTRGVDIGGDWYSMIGLGTDLFAFVVGDVSGKGIDAVAIMARARFTLRAYLLRGDTPDVALAMAARQFDVTHDGHIVTTLVGLGNWRTGEIALANAGHCKPLLVGQDGARFLDPKAGPPLGIGPVPYPLTRFELKPGDTFMAYTDGLIERRDEDIQVGMDRLAAAAVGTAQGSVSDLVTTAVRSLRDEQAEDDIAVLAFRWLGEEG